MNIIIGLGGNVGDVQTAFNQAVKALGENGEITVLVRSSLYRTAAVGPEQPSFLNTAIMVTAEISARNLLSLCHQIEAAAGRDRSREKRWGPRVLDLDLLISDSVVCRGPFLELPHPRLAERAFALIPAAELAPEWTHPLKGRTLAELAKRVLAEDMGAVELLGNW
ncbi:MAG: 2-amino-4-hydroxy-6-hydroxymethyldihydropteridine diphosphokinase [Acidobacteria bacterium]|nr:MAG: 2-amino-4-hydroxy-6-hydroxymethyldihydropteridine diphosphokinase [Acidobacteriota bacterium]